VDLSVFKNLPVTERMKAQFDVEMFNIFNRLNLAPPNGYLFGGFGASTATIGDYNGAPGEDAVAVLQRRGARAILATPDRGDAMEPLVPGLSARGKFIVVGVAQDPIQLNAFPLVFRGRYGSLTGTPTGC
jgi:hypothetical protein